MDRDQPDIHHQISDLEFLVLDAALRFGGKPDGMFNSACFSAAVVQLYGLKNVKDGHWCSVVLSGLAYVELLEGGCHWRYRGDIKILLDEKGRYIDRERLQVRRDLKNCIETIEAGFHAREKAENSPD
jgi:hypothetical protein